MCRQQLDVAVETKTKDNEFVNLKVSVHYSVPVYEAAYKLQNHEEQIRSYVFDVVRSTVPAQTLDETFRSQLEIVKAVKAELKKSMDEFGYSIVEVLVTVTVTDVTPDAVVILTNKDTHIPVTPDAVVILTNKDTHIPVSNSMWMT